MSFNFESQFVNVSPFSCVFKDVAVGIFFFFLNLLTASTEF